MDAIIWLINRVLLLTSIIFLVVVIILIIYFAKKYLAEVKEEKIRKTKISKKLKNKRGIKKWKIN